MAISNEEVLLKEVTSLKKHYDYISQFTGENFNIFKTMRLESNEVRMHSAILAEFLNPQGSHGQKDVFLKLFIEINKIENFDTPSAIAEVEKYTGLINDDYTKGGRIDILITDKHGKHIIIENKIYAGDQKNQLVRYHNYDSNGSLFYLTLDGHEPNDWSTNGYLEIKKDFTLLSYEKDILPWLEECKKEAVSLPIIRETIQQYIHLVNYLTGNSTNKSMENEIVSTIAKSSDYIKSAFAIANSLDGLKVNLILKLKGQLSELANEFGLRPQDRNFGQEKESYYYFYLPALKYNPSICFGFDDWFAGFSIGYVIENKDYQYLNQEDYRKLKDDISSKLSFSLNVKDSAAGQIYSDYMFLHYYIDLQNWTDRPELWAAIVDGTLIKRFHDIIKQIMEAINSIGK